MSTGRRDFPPRRSTRSVPKGLLSILVPTELGGLGATVGESADMVFELGQHCASTAMIYAMHQIQVASLVRHGRSDFLRSYLAQVAEHELLLASATTEIGVGGDVRSSVCTVERTAPGHDTSGEDGAGHLLRCLRRRDPRHGTP